SGSAAMAASRVSSVIASIRAKSLSLGSAASSASVYLTVVRLFAIACPPHGDEPKGSGPQREYDGHVARTQLPHNYPAPLLPIGERREQARTAKHMKRVSKVQSMLLEIDEAFCLVPLELHRGRLRIMPPAASSSGPSACSRRPPRRAG